MNRLLIFFFFITTYSEYILCTDNKTDDIFTIQNTGQNVRALRKIHSKIKSSNSPFQFIDLLEKEAIKQNNMLYTTLAYKEKVYFYSKQSQTDSVKAYLNKISENLDILYKNNNLSEADRKEIEDIRIFATTTKYYIYINENKYDIVLIEVNKILESSKKKTHTTSRS